MPQCRSDDTVEAMAKRIEQYKSHVMAVRGYYKVWTCTCMYVYACVCMCMCMYVDGNQVYACMYGCVYVCICMCICISINT